MKLIFCPKSISNWHQPLKAITEPVVKAQSGNGARNVTLHIHACCVFPPLGSFQSTDSWHFCPGGCLSTCDMLIASLGWCVCLRAFLWTRVSCNAFWSWRLERKKRRACPIRDNPLRTWWTTDETSQLIHGQTLWQEVDSIKPSCACFLGASSPATWTFLKWRKPRNLIVFDRLGASKL